MFSTTLTYTIAYQKHIVLPNSGQNVQECDATKA